MKCQKMTDYTRRRSWSTRSTWKHKSWEAGPRAAGPAAHLVEGPHEEGRHRLLLVLLRADDQGHGRAPGNRKHVARS